MNKVFSWEDKTGKCFFCGWNAANCDRHHIQPISKGGKNTEDNIVELCPNCHRIMHRIVIPHCKKTFPNDTFYMTSMVMMFKIMEDT